MAFRALSVADTSLKFQTGPWFVLVWVETVLVYFAYMQGSGSTLVVQVPEGCTNEIGCKLAASLATWTLVFLELSLMGLIWISLASLGNNNKPTVTIKSKIFTTLQLLLSIGVVIVVTVLSFFYETSTKLFNTTKDGIFQPAYWASFLGGLAILFFQVTRLVGLYFPLGKLESGNMGINEMKTKKAASSKVQTIVEHSLYMHQVPPEFKSMRASRVSETVKSVASSLHSSKRSSKAPNSYKNRSTSAEALLNFHRVQETVEEQGGVLWTMRRFWKGTLQEEDGIYLHGRLLAVNFVQFFVVAIMIALAFTLNEILNSLFAKIDDDCTYRIGDGFELPDFDLDWNRQVKKVKSTRF